MRHTLRRSSPVGYSQTSRGNLSLDHFYRINLNLNPSLREERFGFTGSGTADDILSKFFRGVQFELGIVLKPGTSSISSLPFALTELDQMATLCYDSNFTIDPSFIHGLPSLSIALDYAVRFPSSVKIHSPQALTFIYRKMK